MMEYMDVKEEDELIYLTEQERAFLYSIFFTNEKNDKQFSISEYCKELLTKIKRYKYIL